jgi:hypothetical protein
MTTAKPKTRRRSPAKGAVQVAPRGRLSRVAHRLAGVVTSAGGTAVTIARHVPGTIRATRTRARDTTAALQTLPDSTLHWLAATSVGLSTGLRIARAPRIVVAAGALPALIAGAAIALRPVGPVLPVELSDAASPNAPVAEDPSPA